MEQLRTPQTNIVYYARWKRKLSRNRHNVTRAKLPFRREAPEAQHGSARHSIPRDVSRSQTIIIASALKWSSRPHVSRKLRSFAHVRGEHVERLPTAHHFACLLRALSVSSLRWYLHIFSVFIWLYAIGYTIVRLWFMIYEFFIYELRRIVCVMALNSAAFMWLEWLHALISVIDKVTNIARLSYLPPIPTVQPAYLWHWASIFCRWRPVTFIQQHKRFDQWKCLHSCMEHSTKSKTVSSMACLRCT